MKKALSIFVALAILLTCCMISASAQGKIASSLQAEMNKVADDEPIRVIIWLNNPVDQSEVFRQAIKECGYIGGLPLNMTIEEVDAYRKVYNRIVHEQEAAAVAGFIEHFGLEETCINETYCLCINANLNKAQIEAAAAYSEVEGIYFDDEGLPVEPIETDVTNARYSRFEQLCKSAFAGGEVLEYSELYSHTDSSGETDWILVRGCSNVQAPMPLTTVIGNRVISVGSCEIPFDTGYGIYDVKNDKFVDANDGIVCGYDDFTAVFDEKVTAGRLIGDVDNDGSLSVVDVTIMQRCDARIRAYPADDAFYLTADYGADAHYFSDFNRDGERDILDATCMQRHLIGLSYPTQ